MNSIVLKCKVSHDQRILFSNQQVQTSFFTRPCSHQQLLRLIKLEKGQKLILFFFDLFPMDDDDDEDVDLACSRRKP